MEIHPEPEWEGLFRELKKHKGTAMLLGATDSGKSTLAKYLSKRLTGEGITVSVVDADVGQSSLGLPGTISMKVFSNEKDIEQYTFEKMFFIGFTNPAKKISLMADGSKKMVDICREKSDIIFVDTTGLITGETGRALKIGKIRAIKPEHIIALQRNDELEHSLRLVENSVIHRIGVSIMAKYRDRETRMRYREKKFLDYFDEKRISEFLLHHHDAGFFFNGKSLSLIEGDFMVGAIIGLNHNSDTTALGVICEITADSITFKSPIHSLRGINRVLLSEMTIS
jgi:polynucleotide 5'-hydroxyl-kinase GRC3/NOL9